MLTQLKVEYQPVKDLATNYLMKILKITGVVIIILFIFNYTPISYLLKENYSYTNYDQTFKISEEAGKGFDFDVVKIRYERFLNDNSEQAKHSSQLYRTFTIKPWRIWQWHDYIFQNERFRLPYKCVK